MRFWHSVEEAEAEGAGSGMAVEQDDIHTAFFLQQGEFVGALLRDRVSAMESWVSAMRGAGCDVAFIVGFVSQGIEASESPEARAFYGWDVAGLTLDPFDEVEDDDSELYSSAEECDGEGGCSE